MGFFDKKTCDVCGAKIGMLGKRKLEDGNICKTCAKKLSPWFEDRRHSTVEDIKKQLAYREENREKVKQFVIAMDIPTENGNHVYLDNRHGWFAVAGAMNTEVNPDIVDLSSVMNCMLDIDEDSREDQCRDSEGNWVSYNPPRYSYTYDYWIRIAVNHPWFDKMDFQINSFEVDGNKRPKMMQMENIGRQIMMALNSHQNTGQPTGMGGESGYGGTNQGYGGMNQGGMPGQFGGGMNQGGMPNRGGMNQGYSNQMSGQPGMNQGYQPGGVNPNQSYSNQSYSNSAGNMGTQPTGMGGLNNQPYQQAGGQGQEDAQVSGAKAVMTGRVQCDKCGWVAPNPEITPKFCPMCGDAINQQDLV